MKKIKILLYCGLALTTLAGCKKNLLEVENQNDPDFKKVLADAGDVENLASGLYNTIYQAAHAYNGVEMMMATAADNVTCSWGNAGMRDMSYEPRNNGWNNAASYSNSVLTKDFFNGMYASINTASNVIKAIDNGVVIEGGASGKARVTAFAKFTQGVAYGNLALVFDRAFIVDENVTVEGKLESAVTYDKVAEAAIGYLDAAIATSGTSFEIPAEWLGTDAPVSNDDFKKLCNTMAARILAYTPRNKTQLAAVNWAKVKTYADAGITSDFNVVNDNYTKWYDEAGDYLTFTGWGQTDMYVANMMDPATQPQHWDNSAAFPYPPASTNPIDERLNTDFQYIPSQGFLVARGYYHFSTYRSTRYDDLYLNAVGPKPEVMKAENDMLRAEARAYTGDVAGAAAIINAGTRTTRGLMTNVVAVLVDVVAAIHHERHVEMYTTGMGLQFFEMRKLNLLQKGTPLHFPLPASLLETLAVPAPFYTFGYQANADGIGTSNTGWR